MVLDAADGNTDRRPQDADQADRAQGALMSGDDAIRPFLNRAGTQRRRVRVWFGDHVVADYQAEADLADRYAAAMSRRFAGLRVTSEPIRRRSDTPAGETAGRAPLGGRTEMISSLPADPPPRRLRRQRYRAGRRGGPVHRRGRRAALVRRLPDHDRLGHHRVGDRDPRSPRRHRNRVARPRPRSGPCPPTQTAGRSGAAALARPASGTTRQYQLETTTGSGAADLV